MSMRMRWVLPIQRYEAYGRFMKTVRTTLGFDGSEVAQLRLRCVELLESHGIAAVQQAFPQVSRRSVYRWRKAYVDSGKRLSSLRARSTRPHTVRQMVVPAQILGFLRTVRQEHPHLSKYKLKPFLDAFCREEGLPEYSVSWIGKVLNRHELFFATRTNVRRKQRHPRSGYRVYKTPKPTKLKLGYLQLDGIKIHWNGRKCLFLSCIELKTRQAWATRVPTLSSTHAQHFLESVLSRVPYQVHTIHTDNGSEFKAYFDQAVYDLQLTHVWSPPRSPKIHAHIERFNKTIQEEFINYHIDTAIDEPETFNKQLTSWLTWYNTQRPHHALNLVTPNQFLVQLSTQKGTHTCAKCP